VGTVSETTEASFDAFHPVKGQAKVTILRRQGESLESFAERVRQDMIAHRADPHLIESVQRALKEASAAK
jgi:hypothetical protein